METEFFDFLWVYAAETVDLKISFWEKRYRITAYEKRKDENGRICRKKLFCVKNRDLTACFCLAYAKIREYLDSWPGGFSRLDLVEREFQ